MAEVRDFGLNKQMLDSIEVAFVGGVHLGATVREETDFGLGFADSYD